MTNNYHYGEKSQFHLNSCDLRLQKIFNRLILMQDVSIICGYRNKQDQNTAFKNKKSKVSYPNSKHNARPSMAIDAVPYPTMYKDKIQFYVMAGRILAIAYELNIALRWGGNWDMDNDYNDNGFMDLAHWELVNA